MKNFLWYIALILLFLVLVLIRFFESDLFYDPLIAFYKGNYSRQDPPEFFYWRLLAFTSFRYALNTIISLLILLLIFRKKHLLKFSVLFYGLAWLVLIFCFGFFMTDFNSANYFLVFYLRRFLIQPLFIILLLPAFYYQKIQKRAQGSL